MKAELNARVKILAGPALGQYGTITHIDESDWSASIQLDDRRTIPYIPLKHVELIEDAKIDDRQKLLDRIRKIWAKAESLKAMGPEYEQEALTFAAQAQKMLAKYKLSLSDLEMAQLEKDEPIVGEWHDGKGKRAQVWVEQLAVVVARAHFCRALFSTRGYDQIFLVGRTTDRAVAAFMILTLRRVAEEMSDKAARSFRKNLRKQQGATDYDNRNYRAAWLRGFVERIAERYRDEERKMEVEQQQIRGTSLVLVQKNALAQIDSFIQSSVKTSNRGRGPSERRSGHESSSAGQRDGRNAANNVNIRGTGLGSSKPSRGSLGSGN
jgi:hypothetical protein